MDKFHIKIQKIKQYKEECGSASLLQVLKYFGDSSVSLDDIINYCGEHFRSRDWDYLLGSFALNKNYYARVHSRSLSSFDSTWFDLDKSDIKEKLKNEMRYFEELIEFFPGYKKLLSEVKSAITFLELGGEIDFSSISKNLILSYIKRDIPVTATFTAQLVYNIRRESFEDSNEAYGEPWKHTFVINGFENDRFYVTDPSDFQEKPEYSINSDTLIDAIIRYDSNLLVVSQQKLP